MADTTNDEGNGVSLMTSEPKDNIVDKTECQLRKEIGVLGGVFVLAGIIIGSGIFITPAGILEGVNGSIGLSLVIWAACGIFSTLAALCYAELGTSLPNAGGDYEYLSVCYGPMAGFVYGMCFIWTIYTAPCAAKGIVFGAYALSPFFQGCAIPNIAIKAISALIVILSAWINYYGVKVSSRVQIVFTLAKFFAMFGIVAGGLFALKTGQSEAKENFSNAFNKEVLAGLTVSRVSQAFYQGLFTFGGWHNLNIITEEISNVSKTLPRSIIISMMLVTGFYILMNVSYLLVLTPVEMMQSKAVAFTFTNRIFGSFSDVMALVVCISVFGSINGATLAGSRVAFAMSRRNHFPKIFSTIHVEYMSPGPTIIFQTIIVLILVIVGDFKQLINALTFTKWIFHGMSAASVIILRYRKPNLPRPFKVPIAIPFIVVIFAIYLVVVPLIVKPNLAYLFGATFIAVMPFLYYIFVYKKYVFPGTEAATTFLQFVLNTSPTSQSDRRRKKR